VLSTSSNNVTKASIDISTYSRYMTKKQILIVILNNTESMIVNSIVLKNIFLRNIIS